MKKIVTLTVVLSASLIFVSSLLGNPAAEPGGAAGGASIYNQSCVKCHGAGGKGVENFTPDLTKATNQREWLHIVNNGKGAMPSFKGTLKPAQVNAVIAHVKSLGRGAKRK